MKFIKFLFFLGCILSLSFLNMDKVCVEAREELIELDYEELSENIIRFHFIANSDLEFDQYVKNAVKDRVMDYFERDSKLKSNKSDSIYYLKRNSNKIREIAMDTLSDYGVYDDVSIDIGRKYFDERVYGSYIIPEGIYDYFILNIGEASGRNFWSLLFSSIGFIQSDDKKIDSIPAIIKSNKKDSEVFSSSDKPRTSHSNEVKVSFKIIEIVKGFFQKIF